MATITVSTSAQLTNALQQAAGGDTIQLATGNYGDFSFSGKTFSSEVTIISQDASKPATFNKMYLSSVGNLTIDSVFVDFTPTADTLSHSAGMSVRNGTNITITNSVFEGGVSPVDGLLTGRGISIIDGENIVITNNDVSHFRRGIMTGQVDQLTISYNHVHENRTSTLSGGDVSNVLIEGNHLESSNPNNFGGDGDHGDFIHYWTSTNQTGFSENFVIRGNFIEQGSGTALLGIYLDNNDNPYGFTNVLIENNVLHNSNGQGMRLEDVNGGIVRNNSLLQATGDFRAAPRIRVEDGSQNILLENNIVSNTTAGAAMDNVSGNNIVERGTIVVQHENASAPNYVGNLFTNLPISNGNLADMQKIPGALPSYAGANLTPSMLVTGNNTGGSTGGGTDGGGSTGGGSEGGGTGGGGSTGGGVVVVVTPPVLDDFVLDFVKLIGSPQLRGDAKVATTTDGPVLRFDGDGDFLKLGRMPQFEKSQELSVSIEYEKDVAGGGEDRLVWNHKKLGVSVIDDGLIIRVGTADGKFTPISIKNLGLNDTDKHQITVMVDAATDRIQVVVDDKLVLDNDDLDFQLVNAGGREWGWSLGTAWGRDLDGDITDFSIEGDTHFVDAHVGDLAHLG